MRTTPHTPGFRAREAQDEASSVVTRRAVVLGLLLTVAICLFATDTTYRLKASRVSLGHLPMSQWLPFLLLYLSNVFCKRIRPGLALKPRELGLILCMGFIGGAFPTKNVAGRLVAVLATPYYKASPENRWGDFVLEHIRPWSVPSNDTGAITHLWEGLPHGQGIPWDIYSLPKGIGSKNHTWCFLETPYHLTRRNFSLPKKRQFPGQMLQPIIHLIHQGITSK